MIGRAERLEGVEACANLQRVWLGDNLLQSLAGIQNCPKLWTLDVSKNHVRCRTVVSVAACAACARLTPLLSPQLTSVSSLAHFDALGRVDLSHNHLSLPSLSHIRDVHIVELYTEGNEETQLPGSDAAARRRALVALLPRVWVLDGKVRVRPKRV